MLLSVLDWAIIGFFILLTLFIGIYLSKRASRSITDFFLGGRQFPWYIAGISMVATTFAADTPLAVTELVAQNGISKNWVWWNALIGGMLTTFFFARLWRRANILTEVEFISIRYAGKAAHYLRLFKSVYLGLIMNVAVIAWVNLAFISILTIFFDIPKEQAIIWVFGVCILIGLYSTLSGLWGVAINDVIQFFVAMTGSIALAIFVISSEKVGGIEGLKAALPPSSFDFLPSIGDNVEGVMSIGLASFLAFIGFQWWTSWYPGQEPGGGGYIAQRMMSAKTEKDSLLATMFFQFAHFCLRPWPWILVALAAMALYPELTDKKLGYVMAMRDFLPNGWRGLMLAAFGAAYMSTISTQLNWGAGYLTNDLYVPLTANENRVALSTTGKSQDQEAARQKRLVAISRLMTVALVIIGCVVTMFIETISGVWAFIMECGAGLGLVLILRWYWWRINAWSEIAATIAPFVAYAFCKLVLAQFYPVFGLSLLENPTTFFVTIGFTTIVWITVTFMTDPEPNEHLKAFFERVKPAGLWKPVSGQDSPSIAARLGLWASSVGLIYSALFFMGHLILQFYDRMVYSGTSVALFGALFFFALNRSSKENEALKEPEA